MIFPTVENLEPWQTQTILDELPTGLVGLVLADYSEQSGMLTLSAVRGGFGSRVKIELPTRRKYVFEERRHWIRRSLEQIDEQLPTRTDRDGPLSFYDPQAATLQGSPLAQRGMMGGVSAMPTDSEHRLRTIFGRIPRDIAPWVTIRDSGSWLSGTVQLTASKYADPAQLPTPSSDQEREFFVWLQQQRHNRTPSIEVDYLTSETVGLEKIDFAIHHVVATLALPKLDHNGTVDL